MPKDPERITVAQVRDALEAMGIDRDVTDLESVTLDVDQVTIVRKRRSESGRLVVMPGRNAIAVVTTEIPLVRA